VNSSEQIEEIDEAQAGDSDG